MQTCEWCGAQLEVDGSCTACMLAGGLSHDPAVAADGKVEPHAPATITDTFEPYRIIRLLGEGGMGTVYFAEQSVPIKRQVALKVVKVGIDSAAVLSRFNYERESLAMMDHPNIARVCDAGSSAHGRPYFVMEFVNGVSITEYCDARRLTTAERLALFVPVCHALQHAHQKGIIHRDIKPSNVLVMEQDGQAVPKVIDFGIARATNQREVENAVFTNFGQFIGTPEYMSPEQADLLAGDIDTSSDVYSLGVLLYELLTGVVPFDATALRQAGLAELLRVIREDDAVPMTSKLTGMGELSKEVADRRGTNPGTLRRQISGDLNWIVMKALEKDRSRRYPAVSELAEDIRRHLEDKPVHATPPSKVYLARKFIRRNKLAASAGAVVFAALIAGIAATSWQASVALRERRDAVAARALAEQRSEEAENARNLAEWRSDEASAARQRAEELGLLAEHQRAIAEGRLSDVHHLADAMLFEISDEVKDLPGGTKARESLLRLGHQYLDKEAESPVLDPARRSKLGEAYLKMGELQGGSFTTSLRDFSTARQMLAKGAAILEAETRKSPNDPNARHLLTMAYVRQVYADGGWTSSRPKFESAARSAKILMEKWPSDPQGWRDQAEVYQLDGRYEEAVALRTRVLAANPQKRQLQWELANAEKMLGASLRQKNSGKALEWLEKSLASFRRLEDADPSNTLYRREEAQALMDLASVLPEQSRFDESENYSRKAVAILQQLASADRLNAGFQFDLSGAQFYLAQNLINKSKYTEALESMESAIAIQLEQAKLHPENPDFPKQAGNYLRYLGGQYRKRGDVNGALKAYRRAEEVDRKLSLRFPGEDRYQELLRSDIHFVADMLLSLGEKAPALARYQEAQLIAMATAKPTDESLHSQAVAHRGLATAYRALFRWEEAIAEMRKGVALLAQRAALSPGDRLRKSMWVGMVQELAGYYQGRGDFRSAIAASEEALVYREADYAAHRDDVSAASALWNLLFSLRSHYINEGLYEKGIAVSQRSLEIDEQLPAGHFSEFRTLQRLCADHNNLGYVLGLAGRRKEGLANMRQAISILASHPLEREAVAEVQHQLAVGYVTLSEDLGLFLQPEESRELLRRVIPVLESLVKSNGGNQIYRSTLRRAYISALRVWLDLGDVQTALEMERKYLTHVPEARTPPAVHSRALRLAHTGSLELRLGNRATAMEIWREAAAQFQSAARESEKIWDAAKSDLNSLEALRLSEGWAAFTMDQLGDYAGSLRYRRSAYARAAALFKADPSTPANLDHYKTSQRNAVWLLSRSGAGVDYGQFFENRNPSKEEARAVAAESWSQYTGVLGTFGAPLPQRREAAETAVKLNREVAEADPAAGNKVALTEALHLASGAYLSMAWAARGGERMSAYKKAEASLAEALGILEDLNHRRALPKAEQRKLGQFQINLEEIRERIQAEGGR